MRKIIIENPELDENVMKKVIPKYSYLPPNQIQELSYKIGMEIFIEAAKQKMLPKEAAYVSLISDGEIIIDSIMLITDEKMNLHFELDSYIEGMLKVYDKKEIEKIKNDMESHTNSRAELYPLELFFHPLSDNGNLWSFASNSINAVRGLYEEIDRDMAECALAATLREIDSTLNIDSIMAELKTNNLNTMMRVSNLIGTYEGNLF